MCFRCHATCGRQEPEMVYSDINTQAPWRATEYVDSPWDIAPALAELEGFSERMISIDMMHAMHMGVARDLVGSCVKLLCTGRNVYPGRNVTLRLQQLMREVREYASRNGKSLTFARLKKTNIQWEKRRCPELKAHASDSAVFMGFLTEKLQTIELPQRYAGLTACVWAANQMLCLLTTAGFFLTLAERESAFTLGCVFLKSYSQLAWIAHSNGQLLFKVRPKTSV